MKRTASIPMRSNPPTADFLIGIEIPNVVLRQRLLHKVVSDPLRKLAVPAEHRQMDGALADWPTGIKRGRIILQMLLHTRKVVPRDGVPESSWRVDKLGLLLHRVQLLSHLRHHAEWACTPLPYYWLYSRALRMRISITSSSSF